MDLQSMRDEASRLLRSRKREDLERGKAIVLEFSRIMFQQGKSSEDRPLPMGERRRLEDLVDSGELDVRTVPVVDERASAKRRAPKRVAATNEQRSLF